MSRGREGRSLVFLTILAALLLSVMPLPSELLPLKPYWVALVVVLLVAGAALAVERLL